MMRFRVGETGAIVSNADFNRLPPETQRNMLKRLQLREKAAPHRKLNFPLRLASAYRYVPSGLELPLLQAARLAAAGGAVLANAPVVPAGIAPALAAVIAQGELYQYQATLLRHLSERWADPRAAGRAYLQLGTGLGKTTLACGAIAAVLATLPVPVPALAPAPAPAPAPAARPAGAKLTRADIPLARVLVVVPTDAIREQWLEELADTRAVGADAEARGVAAASLVYSGSTRADRAAMAAAHVLVAIVNTARSLPADLLAQIVLVVADEAHELHSPENSRVLWTTAPLVLALSATPRDRADGLDRYVEFFVGAPSDALAVCPREELALGVFAGCVRKLVYVAPGDRVDTVLGGQGQLSAILTIGQTATDPARLALVVSEIQRLLEQPPATLPRPADAPAPQHAVLVLAEHRQFVLDLSARCRAAGIGVDVPEADGVVVLRGADPDVRASLAAARAARVVVATYGFARRGLSITGLTALVLATPRASGLAQILGRITRRGSDQTIVREVVDVVDKLNGLAGQFNRRREAYARRDWPVYQVRFEAVRDMLFVEPGAAEAAFARAIALARTKLTGEPELAVAAGADADATADASADATADATADADADADASTSDPLALTAADIALYT